MSSNVLLVETDIRVTAAAKRALMPLDYTVMVVASAKEAFAILPTLRPWLIILDENLPDMTGHTFIRELHSVCANAERPKSIMLIKGGDRAFSEDYTPDMYMGRIFHAIELSMFVRRLRQHNAGGNDV